MEKGGLGKVLLFRCISSYGFESFSPFFWRLCFPFVPLYLVLRLLVFQAVLLASLTLFSRQHLVSGRPVYELDVACGVSVTFPGTFVSSLLSRSFALSCFLDSLIYSLCLLLCYSVFFVSIPPFCQPNFSLFPCLVQPLLLPTLSDFFHLLFSMTNVQTVVCQTNVYVGLQCLAGKNPSGFETVTIMELLAYLRLVIATCWLFTLSILFVTTGHVIRPANKMLQKHLPNWIMNNYTFMIMIM